MAKTNLNGLYFDFIEKYLFIKRDVGNLKAPINGAIRIDYRIATIYK